MCKKIFIVENGRRRRVTVQDAMLAQLGTKGAGGNLAAIRDAVRWAMVLDNSRENQAAEQPDREKDNVVAQRLKERLLAMAKAQEQHNPDKD